MTEALFYSVTDTLAEMEAETPGDTLADLKVKAPLSALGDKGGDRDTRGHTAKSRGNSRYSG